ncbi:MAG: AAA family ATPase [Desulfamplus sp.]|nr:AAA family ATPase [Desulfamplus sp.]
MQKEKLLMVRYLDTKKKIDETQQNESRPKQTEPLPNEFQPNQSRQNQSHLNEFQQNRLSLSQSEQNEFQHNQSPQNKETCYYSKSLYFDELYVAKRVSAMCKGKTVSVEKDRVDRWISLYCKAKNITLSDEQAKAVSSVVFKPFSILTGGPGCGKTTTTFVIVKLIEAMGEAGNTSGKSMKIMLTAPTGRAAQRMTEVIGMEAKTIHRLLEWQGGEFKKNEKTPLKADFLIVDECSMLDINLTASLLKAVPESCKVLFIGDADQLPSVGAGNVLKDMIASGVVPCFVLTQIFRQAEESLIIKYAHQINKGIMPWIGSPFKDPELWRNHTDCMFIDSDESTKEQIHFIKHVKHACSLRSSKEIESDNSSDNLPSKPSNHSSGNPSSKPSLSQPSDHLSGNSSDYSYGNLSDFYEFRIGETVKPYETEIKIPKKFQHVNIDALYKADTEVRELMAVLKNVHPCSSLHYGYAASDVVRELYQEWIPKYYGKGCEIQILSPMTRGSLGTMNLNSVIQASANPAAEGRREIKVGERIFRIGDRVIHRRNNYDLGVFNGDIGTIVDIDTMDLACSVSFYPDNKVINYQRDDILELDLAYAITIHKSQGSEFDIVIIPVLSQHFKMLFRNLVYTGLTRAKKLAVFVGTRKAMAMAVKNQDISLRQTALESLLQL